jgi:large subunit ribosomal protein L15
MKRMDMDGIYIIKKPEYIKKRKRVGRGNSSGHGTTSCRGTKGQLSRSGSKKRAWFEGGQMPLQRRVPKRGFNNYTQKDYQIINLTVIDRLGSSEINPLLLKKEGAISHPEKRVKILGKGEITKAVKVTADAFSKTAMEKIKKAGGEAIIREFPIKKKADS